jgi:hypothetical protein
LNHKTAYVRHGGLPGAIAEEHREVVAKILISRENPIPAKYYKKDVLF